ncbi:MAG: hypothetical protein IKS47_06525 [Bacteroidales bacterium]|nr:hypothetical protein [Bacteroidales bacterium]
MKRIFLAAACLLAAATLLAQPQKPSDEQRKKDFERIKSEKIAFLTAELDLTPEEAQVFWPVYNQCWKVTLESHKNMMEAFDAIRGKKADELSDKELEAKLDAYIAAQKAHNLVLSDWYPKFREVLPVRKVAKLYQAEEDFQRRMIDNIRKHGEKQQGHGQRDKK